MAIRRQAASQPLTNAQQVFKPRATLGSFTKIFPMLYVGFGVVMVASLAAGFFLGMWLIPLMAAIPMASVIATGLYAQRMTHMRVVLDLERLRVFSGKQPTLNLAWHQITRLTIRDVQGGNMYEVWVKDKATPLMAEFFEDSDKMLQAVSARTSLAWEKL
ncbi:MAG: hypothetical protein ACK46X_20295 [Candidatus Sericytochromatia bacterium]